MSIDTTPSRAPLPLIAGFALFLATIGYAVVASFARPSVVTFEPSAPAIDSGGTPAGGVDTLTVDASDDAFWRYVDVDRNRATVSTDTARWDIAFRRHTIMTAVGARDIGEVDWDSVKYAPAGDYGAAPAGADSTSPALRRWYRYRMLTHVLEPKGNVYVIRTAEGGYAKLQILSYYCPGPRAGCPTVRVAPLHPAP